MQLGVFLLQADFKLVSLAAGVAYVVITGDRHCTWVCDLTTPAAVVATLQDTVVPVRRQRKLAASPFGKTRRSFARC